MQAMQICFKVKFQILQKIKKNEVGKCSNHSNEK